MAVSLKAPLSTVSFGFCLLLLAAPNTRAATEPPSRYQAKLPAIRADQFPSTAEVELAVETNAYGFVTRVEVRRTTNAALGEFCAAAVRRWRYAPAREYGQPVAARFIQPFRFTGGTLQAAAAQLEPSPRSTDQR
jgi:outer membrane biosynthesis protein TonB